MTHTYKVTGMTCGKCLATVKSALSKIQGIQKADVTLDPPQAVITMSTHVPTAIMNKQLAAAGKYTLEETESMHHEMSAAVTDAIAAPEEKRSFFTAYKPILLVFGYLIGMTVLNELFKSRFNLMSAMHLFMGGFFLIFSFFKLLDLKGFAYSYMSYDIIAKKWIGWGYIYPLIELSLGVAFLFHFAILEATIITLVVMSVSSIGVIQSLIAKNKINY